MAKARQTFKKSIVRTASAIYNGFVLRNLIQTGNSKALILTKDMRDHLGIEDEVEVEFRRGSIVLRHPEVPDEDADVSTKKLKPNKEKASKEKSSQDAGADASIASEKPKELKAKEAKTAKAEKQKSTKLPKAKDKDRDKAKDKSKGKKGK